MASGAVSILRGSIRIPTSKPHTQRALLMATLADGESTIRRPNVCSESNLLQAACAELGARFDGDSDVLVVRGVSGKPTRPNSVLQVAGSGFALRHLLPIAALAQAPCVLTGDRGLAARPVRPLLDALTALGARVEPADPELVLPVVTWSTGMPGGTVKVPATETSQFVSALMVAAPYAMRPVRLRLPGEAVSHHYIRMTGEMMARFGAEADIGDLRCIDVRPGAYEATDISIGPDVTSLFYFIAAAVITDCDILIEDVQLGEDAFLDSVVALGRRLGVHIDQSGTGLRIRTGAAPDEEVVIDAAGIPTLVPALAAIATGVPDGIRLYNARHIRHHKTNRLGVVLTELARMGRVLQPQYHDGQLDGFRTDRVESAAVDQVDSHGDHRNFMALSLAAMAVDRPVRVLGTETLNTSFAEFEDCFRTLSASPART
jgi:3-phosphoshikimate 1-carboxyvinyltransferase